MYEMFKKCCEIFKQAIVYDISQLIVAKILKNVYLKTYVGKKMNEYTRQMQSVCGCYNVELSCDVMTVLFFIFITDRSRRNAKYCHFFMTSILVRNS